MRHPKSLPRLRLLDQAVEGGLYLLPRFPPGIEQETLKPVVHARQKLRHQGQDPFGIQPPPPRPPAPRITPPPTGFTSFRHSLESRRSRCTKHRRVRIMNAERCSGAHFSNTHPTVARQRSGGRYASIATRSLHFRSGKNVIKVPVSTSKLVLVLLCPSESSSQC